ncbi:MAG: hypothetical protein QF918_07575 [Pirellulaceae bacterium]|nr:hypothetical protein [Pirellulaceae bacterium]MDP6555737.1 hypothetical protein [Pirellulaceae bacterium]MDP6719987.1 hypothetical protein [Pirellulaceae bacterium]
MNSRFYIRLIVVTFLVSCCTQVTWAQSRDANRIKRELDESRDRISGQRVSRQAEVIRLEQMIERLQARVTRLERQSMGSNHFPAVSVMEAKAVLNFAEEQLKESERLFKRGAATENQVASDRLAVVRARAQVNIAKAAQMDRRFSLELGVTHAEIRLADVMSKQDQLKRMVAKGFATARGLELRNLDVDQAQKELLRARARLEFQRQLTDTEEAKSADTDR